MFVRTAAFAAIVLCCINFGNCAPPAPAEGIAVDQAIEMMRAGGNWTTANEKLLQVLRAREADPGSKKGAIEEITVYGDETAVKPLTELSTSADADLSSAALAALDSMKRRNVQKARERQSSGTAVSAPTRKEKPLTFERQKISSEKFEASSAFDVNHDGKIDIVSGPVWYAGPDFVQSHKICDMKPSGEYFDDFSDYPIDVNGDGFMDVITGGFFGGPLRWRENPKGATTEWTEHAIAQAGAIETTRFWDLDGDKIPEIVPNAGGNIIAWKLMTDASGKGTGEFTSHTIKQGGNGHGLGYGDVNGDGRGDFIGNDGWFEAPEKPMEGPQWKYHAEFKLGMPSVPILVYDVNGDGRNDLIVGESHNYGLYWLEQTAATGKEKWVKHMIDADRSQYHDLALIDIDKDGKDELITGQRYRAHNGHDPGESEPIGLYYFNMYRDGGDVSFERVTLDYGPPDRASGAGIYFWIEDVDGNGWKDVVAPGKQGLYLFRNMGQNSK